MNAPPSRYAMGPANIVADGWPSSWRAYAEAHYAPPRPGVPDVRVRCLPAGDDPQSQALATTVSELEVRREQGGWIIRNDNAFEARLDAQARTLDVAVWAQLDVPHVTLGNALRGLVHLLLPMWADGLMFHASSGVLDGRGVAFAGVSTAGKTTLALGMEEAKFLSDDISLVRDLTARPRLIASPFFGSAGRRGFKLDAPLAAFGLLEKDPERTRVERVGRKAALMHLLRHAVSFTRDPGFAHQLMALVDALAARVPIFVVHRCLTTPSDEVVRQVLKEADA